MKKEISMLVIVFVAIGFLLLIGNLSRDSFTGFAVYEQGEQSDFDQGTYNNTEYSGSAVVLSSGQSSGTYTSEIFDATNDATWNSLTATSSTPTAKTLFVVDGGGDVYSSSDGGTAWALAKEDYGRSSATIEMISNSDYLYILSTSNREVFRSSDFETWEMVNDSFADSAVLLGEVDSLENLYIADASGDVYLSSDDGVTWTLQGDFNAGATNNGKGMAIDSSGNIYIVDGSGAVWKSSNSGVDWVEQTSAYGGGAGTDDLEVDASDNLYILNNDEVMKSIDDGVTWVQVEDDFSPYSNEGCKMLIDGDEDFFLADCSGRVFQSSDSGVSWDELGDSNLGASNDIKGITDFYSATTLTYEVRNCSESDCSDGTFEDQGMSGLDLTGRYFQYKVSFVTPGAGTSPELSSVSIDYTEPESDSPSISFSSSTTAEGTYSNVDFINVDVDLADASQIYSFINFNNSLIGFWKLNESSGNIIDYSGYGNDGTNNGAIYGSSGKFGGALGFDGTNDYLYTANDDLFDFNLTDSFALSAWINTDSSENMVIINKMDGATIYRGYSLFVLSSGKVRFILQKSSAAAHNTFDTNAIVNDGNWHLITATYNGTGANGMQVYVDGIKDTATVSAVGTTDTIASSSHLAIGSRYAHNDLYFNGSIDEVLIFNRALSSDEISVLYSASSYSITYSNLSYDTYEFYAYAQDVYGNEAQTETRTVTLSENAPPTLTSVSPQDGASYGYNESLALNYVVSDIDDNLDSCWYVLNSGSPVILSGCANSSIDVPEGSNTLTVYANDTLGEEISDSATFNVAVGAPSISLISPINESFNSYDITFTYTPTDVDLESCSLLGNFGGDWEVNQTDGSPTSGVENIFSLTLGEGDYIWNIQCNDSIGNVATNGNKSFSIDTTNPSLTLIEPTGTKTSRTISAEWSVSDVSPVTCKYNVLRGETIEVANTSVDCSADSTTFDVTVDADFVFHFYVNDSAGNSNSGNSSFIVDTSTSPPVIIDSGSSSSGGGGGGSSIYLPVEITGISDIIADPGNSKKMSIQVKNSGRGFLNDCVLKSQGDTSSWISSNTAVMGLSPGEEQEIVFILNIPEVLEEGSYEINLTFDCNEYDGHVNFTVEIIKEKLALGLIDIKQADRENLQISYSLKELTGKDQEVNVEIVLVDSDNERVAEFLEVRTITANSEQEFEIVLATPLQLKGNFNLLINAVSETSSAFVQEEVILGSLSRIGGFAIFDLDEGSFFGVIIVGMFILFGVFMIVRIFRLRKKARTNKCK